MGEVVNSKVLGKKLKIALAMGGGVSLGTFSGAALTEALKLIIIYGKPKKNNNAEYYTDFVVDGMSGASAGTVALVLMLRSLLNFKKVIKDVNLKLEESDKISEVKLIERLNETYFKNGVDAFVKDYALKINLSEQAAIEFGLKLKNILIALELTQFVQHLIWVKTLDIKDLSKNVTEKKYEFSKRHSFLLLNRNSLIEILNEFLAKDHEIKSEEISLLDNRRVVFACSLTSLLPIEYYQDYLPEQKTDLNTKNSMSSKSHTELRVLDFTFKNNIDSDSRWLTFDNDNSDSQSDGLSWHYNSKEAWTIVGASALACAAFPIAFSPILLKRFESEYKGEDLKYAANKHGLNRWPPVFVKINKDLKNNINTNKFKSNSFLSNEKKTLDYKSFNLPYIDGGTFNNEPIKEAYNIASFQDYSDNSNFDRLLLFVDPSVPTVSRSHFLNAFNGLEQDESDKKLKVGFQTELGKAKASIGDIMTTLMNQGSVKEFHKVTNTINNFILRDELFKYIENSIIEFNFEMVQSCKRKIESFLQKDHISCGTRNVDEYLQDYIKKHTSTNDNKNIKEIENVSSQILNNDINSDGLDFVLKKHPDEGNIIKGIILKILVEVSLDTLGKNKAAKLISIFPKKVKALNVPNKKITKDHDDHHHHQNDSNDIIKLPGHEFEAFSGFSSELSRNYSFEYGRLSALQTLFFTTNDTKMYFELSNTLGVKPLTELNDNLLDNINQIDFYSKSNKDKYVKDVKFSIVDWLIRRIAYIKAKKKFFDKISGLFGILLIKVKWVRNIALKKLSIEQTLNSELLKEINVIIKNTSGLKSKSNFLFKNYFELHLENSNENSQKVFYEISKKGEILFKLYLFEKDNNLYLSSNKYMKHPNIDPNIYPTKWQNKLNENHSFVTNIVFKNRIIDFQFLKDKNQSLYYSLAHLEAHINPCLVFDCDLGSKEEWVFLENTISIYDEVTN